MTEFDQTAFFDAIVDGLVQGGQFKTKKQSVGKTRKSRSVSKHKAHAIEGKDADFTAVHPGDDIYYMVASQDRQYYADTEFKPAERHLRAAVLRAGIGLIFPMPDMIRYQRYFLENLNEPSHRDALRFAFARIGQGLSLTKLFDNEELERRINDPDCKRNQMRWSAGQMTIIHDIKAFPELMLALAVFHASHLTYIEQMKEAVARNPALGGKEHADERDNLTYALNAKAYDQFKDFIVPHSMVAFILRNYYQRAPYPVEGEVDHEAMKKAIGEAWALFYQKQMQVRDYTPDHWYPAPGEKPAYSTSCPTTIHFDLHQKNQTIEQLYDYIVSHKQALQPELDRAARIGKALLWVERDFKKYPDLLKSQRKAQPETAR